MKKQLTLLLALALALGLMACQTSETPPESSDTTAPSTETTTATEPNATVTEPTATDTEPVPTETEHKHSYTEVVISPTCTEKGYTTHTCACGDTYIDNELAALGHDYVNGSCQRCNAASEYSAGLKYELLPDGSAYRVVGIGSCTDANVIIPTTHEGLPVTALSNFALANSNMTSIVIPDSVTSIGAYLFAGCDNLANITIDPANPVYCCKNNCIIETASRCLVAGCKASVIPEDGSVVIIGMGAFHTCKNLSGITMPNTLTSIEESAFYGCNNLTNINIPSSVTSIGKYAFTGCANLGSLTVDSKNPVYHSAQNCIIQTAVKTVVASCKNSVIPTDGSVTAIGEYAFSSCAGLTEITIPDSVTKIDTGAFEACKELKTVTLPNNLTCIQKNTFSGCSALTIINLSDKLTTIGEYAFASCAFSNITIPASVTSIQGSAFMGCPNLESITFPDGITVIGPSMFYRCENLAVVTLPSSVTAIELYAFNYCAKLTRINFNGTRAQWAAVSKGINWDANTGTYTVNCTDGEITK